MNKKHKWFTKVQALCMALMITLTALCQTGTAEAAEVVQPSLGIDVSRYQGQIDWARVADAGVQFAFVRIGGRYSGSGAFYDDTYFDANLAGAVKNGIPVGVYFFSQALNAEEAAEE